MKSITFVILAITLFVLTSSSAFCVGNIVGIDIAMEPPSGGGDDAPLLKSPDQERPVIRPTLYVLRLQKEGPVPGVIAFGSSHDLIQGGPDHDYLNRLQVETDDGRCQATLTELVDETVRLTYDCQDHGVRFFDQPGILRIFSISSPLSDGQALTVVFTLDGSKPTRFETRCDFDVDHLFE